MAGQTMVDVVFVPAIDSKVTSLDTVSAPPGSEHTDVVSVCCSMGTQLTEAHDASSTTMDVLEGKERCTPMRLSPSPPLVR